MCEFPNGEVYDRIKLKIPNICGIACSNKKLYQVTEGASGFSYSSENNKTICTCRPTYYAHKEPEYCIQYQS